MSDRFEMRLEKSSREYEMEDFYNLSRMYNRARIRNNTKKKAIERRNARKAKEQAWIDAMKWNEYINY